MPDFRVLARPSSPPTMTKVQPGQPVPAEAVRYVGEVEIRQTDDMATRVVVGVERGLETNAYNSYRRVHYTQDGVYVVANPYQTITNAINLLKQTWGTPGIRMHGEIILPPGQLGQLSASIDLDFPQNLTVIGHGCGADEVGPGFGNYGTTELQAPNSGWCFRVLNTGSDNYAGPRFENISLKSGNGAGGGIYIKRTHNSIIRNVSVYGFTSGNGIELDGTGNNSQYNYLERVTLAKCYYGLRLHQADLTGVHILISGNHNGSDSIIPGSVGWYCTGGGSSRTFATIIQGHDTLMRTLSQADYHDALRLEDWLTYGIHLNGINTGNEGFQARVQSANNYLGITNHGATTDRFARIETGIKNAYIFTRHAFASLAPQIADKATPDVAGGDPNGYGVGGSNVIHWIAA